MCTSGFSTWACSDGATSIRESSRVLIVPPRKENLLDFPAFQQRLRDRAGVDVLELTAERYAARDAADPQFADAQHLGHVVRRGLALVGEVGGQDHFLHLAVAGALQQPV